MNKLARPLPVVVLVVLLLAAAAGCSSSGGLGSGAAATVNGTDISMSELYDDLAVLADSDSYTSQLQQSGTEVFGSDGKTYTTQFVAGWLSTLIQTTLAEQQLQSLGGSPTDDEISQAQNSYKQLAQSGEVPQDFIDRLVQASATYLALQRVIEASAPATEVTDGEVRQYYDDNIDSIMERAGGDVACVSAISAPYDPNNTNVDATGATTEATPDQKAAAEQALGVVEARLRSGEDFQSLVDELSSGQSSTIKAADISCVTRSGSSLPEQILDAVYSLPVGQPSEPIATTDGVHLILVRSRGVWPYDEAQSAIRSQLEQQKGDVTQVAANDFLQAASIHVDPRFGTFDMAQAQVVPPEGPSSPSTTSPLGGLLGGTSNTDGSTASDSTP